MKRERESPTKAGQERRAVKGEGIREITRNIRDESRFVFSLQAFPVLALSLPGDAFACAAQLYATINTEDSVRCSLHVVH